MQRFSPKASSVLEKKIFKGFYYIWAWRPPWSMNCDHFSNLSFPQPKEAPYEICAKLGQRPQRRSCLKFWIFFPYKCIRKQNWPHGKKVKIQCTTIILATLVDRPVSNDICKDSAIRHPRFWRTRFLKVFPYKCIGKQIWPCRKKVKCQYTTFILAILVDIPSPMTYAKIQPQGILRSEEEDF